MVTGRYRLDSHLGSGGMGTVWRGWDERLRRKVAVKEVTIPHGMPEDEADRLRERYLREARAAARLRHPAVVGVYDVIQDGGVVWIVMELVDARDLSALLRSDGPIEPSRAAAIGLQLLDALEAAHAAGVLHRDVKPANVLIDSTDRVVLTDFGVASVTGDSSLTRTGQLVGSPAYLAPERLTGGTVGPASDLWSLGCTLYAAVEGKPPFHRPEQFAIIAAITVEPVPHAQHAGLLGPVLYGLLEKDQNARWDAARTRAALEEVAEGRPATDAGWGAPTVARTLAAPVPEPAPDLTRADRPVSPAAPDGGTVLADPPAPPQRRRSGRRALLAGALAIVALAAAGGWAYWQNVDRPTADPLPGPSSVSPTPSLAASVRTHVDRRHGFQVDVPTNWSYRYIPETTTTRFNVLSGAGRTDEKLINSTNNLYVYVHPADGQDALQVATAEDAKWRGTPTFRDYKTLRLTVATMGAHQGALLEFTYTNEKTGPRHVLIFRVVENDISYEVSLNGPAHLFRADERVFDTAVDSLTLLNTTPGPTPSA